MVCTDEERALARGSLQQAVVDAFYMSRGQLKAFFDHPRIDVSFVPAGSVRGEVRAGPVTAEQIEQVVRVNRTADFEAGPGGGNNITVVFMTGEDLARMVKNTVEHAVSTVGIDPSDPYQYTMGEAYPYTSGLWFDVDVTKEEPAQNIEVYNPAVEGVEWSLIEFLRVSHFGGITTSEIFDSDVPYLSGVEVLDIITYNPPSFADVLVAYLSDKEAWEPPSTSEMSTVSFTTEPK